LTFNRQSAIPKSLNLTADQLTTVFNLRKAPPGFEGLIGQEEVKEDQKSLEDLAIEDAYNEYKEEGKDQYYDGSTAAEIDPVALGFTDGSLN
jgi:hypothetical protein